MTLPQLLLFALAVPAPARVELAPCDVPGLARQARCGSHEVFEDRVEFLQARYHY